MKNLKNVFYWLVGSLFLLSIDARASIPFVDKMDKDVKSSEGMFSFFDDLFREGATLAFVVIGVIVFAVWLSIAISKLFAWKNEKLETMELFSSLAVSLCVVIFIQVFLIYANKFVAA